jgi:hypothetical protein
LYVGEPYYGKRPNNSNTLIIKTPLDLSHFGKKTAVLIIHTPPHFGFFTAVLIIHTPPNFGFFSSLLYELIGRLPYTCISVIQNIGCNREGDIISPGRRVLV